MSTLHPVLPRKIFSEMISQNIQAQIREAMKARDAVRLSTLKLLSAELHNEWIAKQHELSEEEELAVVRREVKKRKEMIEICNRSGKPERARSERDELAILQEFLPAEMDDAELEEIVKATLSETGASSMSQMGKVVGIVKSKVGGRADGARIADMVRAKLT